VCARSCKALGRWEDASIAADTLIESAGPDQSANLRSGVTMALVIKAEAARRAGTPNAGLPWVQDAIARASEDRNAERLSEALSVQAELLYAMGRTKEAIASYGQVITLLDGSPGGFANRRVAVARGRRLRMQVSSKLRFGRRPDAR
jgi:tetratricopeptide (TPR) repeat protein